MILAIALSLGCLAIFPKAVLANEEYVDSAEQTSMSFDLEGITVEGSRPDWETKLSPGSVTVVHPDDFKGEQKTLPDLLLTVPGVHVREVNGKGQYTTVTVRGSTAAQVGIFIDGVLANLGGDSAVDLSTIPVQNVERIEVYRGYVPSRFGGTFIGGVVNIVTKRPMKSDVALELGRSSYGGRKGAMEITSPLGEGTLMLGVNYESSDGDFDYKNYAAERYIPTLQTEIANTNNSIENFDNENIDNLIKSGLINSEAATKVQEYKNDPEKWLRYIRGDYASGTLYGDIFENRDNYAEKQFASLSAADFKDKLITNGVKDIIISHTSGRYDEENWFQQAATEWNNPESDRNIGITQNVYDKLKDEYIDAYDYKSEIEKWQNSVDPEKSEKLAALKEKLEKEKKKLKEAKDANRTRKYNDYENTSTIVKWQSEDFVVKGTYNKIDRHLPDGVWGGDANAAVENNAIDLYDMYYYDSRRQVVESTGLMLQDRNTSGKLEWGWLVDYLHKDSNYRAENIYPTPGTGWTEANTPFREWSEYKSDKYNAQIDGSYKLGEKSMIDFQMNYSKERMDVDGSNLDKVINSDNAFYAQVRNRYDQEIFNFQLQNSITLDKKGSWIATPAVRYNRSTITGYSDGSRFGTGYYGWIKPKDEQTDSKVTWQMALKKEFDESFAMRMTGGTYYRLLNMSEIAGDGAGILPAPADERGSGTTFPLPEEGKQFDISAVVNGKFLGAENRTTLTYFWRESDNMLQLVRAGKDYWCYFNDNRGETDGVELLSSFRWPKFDLDMQITYLNPYMERQNTKAGYDYSEIWATYQPQWEGNVRLTYRPSEKYSIFTEAHYTDEYFTNYDKSTEGGEKAYLSGKPVSDLLTMNAGLKWQPRDNWQFTFGCNDIFNAGPEMKIRSNSAYTEPGYINPEFPIQGRTYYVNAKANF